MHNKLVEHIETTQYTIPLAFNYYNTIRYPGLISFNLFFARNITGINRVHTCIFYCFLQSLSPNYFVKIQLPDYFYASNYS